MEELALLPYEELIDICFGDSELKDVVDCEWGVWRDRAYSEGIPEEYFDLAKHFGRDISGLERYLEITTFKKLTRHSAIKVHSNFIEGVYEAYAGLKESLFRNDPKGVGIFLPRVKGAGRKEIVHEEYPVEESALALETLSLLTPLNVNISPLDIKVQEAAKQPKIEPPSQATYEDLLYLIRHGNIPAFQKVFFTVGPLDEELFINTLISGELSFLYGLLPYHFPLIKGYTISGDIPLLPFSLQENFPLYDVGLRREPNMRYLAAAVESLNPQIVDFFRSLYNIEKIPGMTRELVAGYNRKRDPVAAFSILQRLEPPFDMDSLASTGDIDLFLYALPYTKITRELVETAFLYNQGNIPFLNTLIKVASKKSKKVTKNILSPLLDKKLYPLTAELVENLY